MHRASLRDRPATTVGSTWDWKKAQMRFADAFEPGTYKPIRWMTGMMRTLDFSSPNSPQGIFGCIKEDGTQGIGVILVMPSKESADEYWRRNQNANVVTIPVNEKDELEQIRARVYGTFSTIRKLRDPQ